MEYTHFALTVRGDSHIRHDKPCQDASACCGDDNAAVIVVCDGHGGSDYPRSDVGARFAADAALAALKDFAAQGPGEDADAAIEALEKRIVTEWREKVQSALREAPVTHDERGRLSMRAQREGNDVALYGTTLLAVLVTEGYWLGLQVGDGKCVAMHPSGRMMRPIPEDAHCFLNETTSICDTPVRFRHIFSRKLPLAVFIATDGVDKSFKSDEQLFQLYRTVMVSFVRSREDQAVRELKDYLPRLSARGSGDDLSVAAILNLSRVAALEGVRDFDRAKERQRVEDARRTQAEAVPEAPQPTAPEKLDEPAQPTKGEAPKGLRGVIERARQLWKQPPVEEAHFEPIPTQREIDVEKGDEILAELRRLMHEIGDRGMRERIDRIGAVSASIFAVMKERPETAGVVRKLLNYYLPTQIQLLRRYALLEKQVVQGSNIRASRAEIEKALDRMIPVLEEEQDKLFQMDALQISAEIDVLETKLRMDGMLGSEFSAPPEAPAVPTLQCNPTPTDEETPVIRLTL